MASKTQLQELLEILDEVSETDVDRTTISGLACARTSSDLHLAVPTGVLTIPLADIEDVKQLGIDNPRAVSVTFKNAGAPRFVRRPGVFAGDAAAASAPRSLRASLARLARFGDTDGGDIEWPPIYGPGVSTQFCVTTVTDANACDDFECESQDDDLE